ncbi:hypothetical protein STEG23_032487, partial [Scotinomys teguina]
LEPLRAENWMYCAVPLGFWILDDGGRLSRDLQRTPLDCIPSLPDTVPYPFT